jgi:hypothetical protein
VDAATPAVLDVLPSKLATVDPDVAFLARHAAVEAA